VAHGVVMQGTEHVERASFDSLRADWAALVPASVTPFPFQSVEWAEAWWGVFGAGNELMLLGVRDERGSLIGVAPLMGTAAPLGRTIQFIGGTEITDYLDVIAAERDVRRVWSAVIGYLLEQRGLWDALDFHCLPQWSPSQATLADLLADALPVQSGREEVCPILHIPGSFEGYVRALPKKERHEIRRKARNFERDAPSARLRILTERHEAMAALPDFFRLHRLSAPDKERFLTPDVERFFTAITATAAEAGWLRLFMLDLDGTPAAAMYTFVADGRMLIYNSGFDPTYAQVSVGMVLTAMVIEDAARIGLSVCDFLRGNETYKYRFGAADTPIWRVVAANDADAVRRTIMEMEEALQTPADVRDLTDEERSATEVTE
jgi:CelD/BcsL family acetyltransferase involved in cellulose biosynthesis